MYYPFNKWSYGGGAVRFAFCFATEAEALAWGQDAAKKYGDQISYGTVQADDPNTGYDLCAAQIPAPKQLIRRRR